MSKYSWLQNDNPSPEDLKSFFKDLGFQIIEIDVGDEVLCDLCNKSYKDSEEKGGFLFESKAVCPDCADRFEESAKKYNEQKYILARANKDETFRDFVYRIRKERG